MDKESRPTGKRQPWPAHQIAEAFAAQHRELTRLRRLQTAAEITCFNIEAAIRTAEERLASITVDLADAIQVREFSSHPASNEVSS